MKKFYFIFFVYFHFIALSNTIGFEKNIGQIKNQFNQTNTSILYGLRLNGFQVNLKYDGFQYDFYEKSNDKINTHRLEFIFKDYNTDFTIENSNELTYNETSYLDGKENNVSFFQKITYKNFYQNIDLEFYVNNHDSKPFEYNFILHPGADINHIQFEIKGAKAKLNGNQLKFNLRFGELVESLPKSWIEATNNIEIDVEYCYHTNGNIGLQTDRYISNKKIVIDPLPIRKWGSYLSKYFFNGYPTDNHFMNIDKVKFFGNDFYIFGTTSQKNLATEGAYQASIINTYQPFIAKFNNNSQRLWFTYYGSGFNTEYAKTFDLDSQGNIYVTYTTYGNGMATENAFQVTKNDYADFIISKFNPNGQRIWSTYYGGNLNDNAEDLVVDKTSGFVYIVGTTESNDLIHPENVQNPNNSNGFNHGLILKLDLNGNYISSTYTPNAIKSLAIDNNHNLIFSGRKSISSSELTPPFTTSTGNTTLSKYSNNLNLIWSKNFLGDGYMNEVTSIVTDQNNNIFVTGATTSTNGIVYGNAYSPTYQFSGYISYAGFLKKLDTNGVDIFGTYVGAKDYTFITDAVLGMNNEIILSGNATNIENIILDENPHQALTSNGNQINGNGNALLMKFDNSGNPIWGFLAGDSSYSNRYHSLDYNHISKDIITVGWNVSPTMISTPNGYQTKPIYDHEYNRLTGYNGTMTLYSDIENNFKIEKTENNCDIHSMVYLASGATSYTWYDYEGNIVGNTANFSPPTVGQFTCKFDDGTNVGYISIIVQQPNLATPPVPVQPNLQTITAYCNVTLESPKAISACRDEIIGTTIITEFDTPGEYEVVWYYVDQFGNQTTQNQTVIILPTEDFIPDNLRITKCENEINPNFDLTVIENDLPAATYQYYRNQEDLSYNIQIPDPSNSVYESDYPYFYIKGTLANGCSVSKRVDLVFETSPQIVSLQKSLCDAQNIGSVVVDLATYSDEVSSDTVKYYADENLQNEINSPIPIANNQTIYTTATNISGCTSVSTITFTLTNYTLIDSSALEICKNENTIGNFNLSDKRNELAVELNVSPSQVIFFSNLNDAQNNANPIGLNFSNASNLLEIYATIISENACKTYYKIPLIENFYPTINLENEYYKCKNTALALTLNQEYETIEWSNGQTTRTIEITTPGEYFVKIKTGLCETIHHFTVHDYPDLNIDYAYDGQTITFNITNDITTQISMDQINWNHTSFNLIPGEYTFYFKSSKGCIESKIIYINKDIPSFISPNGDGINDVLNLSYIQDLKTITIVDRFGKLIFHKDKSQQPIIWDGKFNDKKLPSASYWYTIDLDNGKKINGSILLKNKN